MPETSSDHKSFPFSSASLDDVRKDLGYQIEAIEMSLSELEREFTVTTAQNPEFPIIPALLNLTHDPDELEDLALALPKVADYISRLDDLRRRKEVLDTIASDLDWFEASFHDVPQIPDSLDELDF